MDWPGVQQVQESSGEQAKMEKSGCKIICGAPNDPCGQEIDDDDDGDEGMCMQAERGYRNKNAFLHPRSCLL